ncbi:MAG: hypothetical protein ABFC63_12160 [Thermoguttaceae bacterium]
MSNARSMRSGWPVHRSLNGLLSAHVRRGIAISGLSLLIAAAGFVFWRHAAGALRHPLNPAALLVTAAGVAVFAAGIRRLLGRSPSRWPDRLIAAVVSLAVLELTVGLCVPGVPAVCFVAVCAIVAVEEAWAWWGQLGRYVGGTAGRPSCTGAGPVDDRLNDRRPHGEMEEAAAGPADNPVQEAPSERVVQQLTRSQAADGTEEVSGWLRASFVAGQRTASVHVGFCPPLGSVPEVSVEQVEGPETRIKAAQVLAYGARLDLKLAAVCDEPADVLLEFSARAQQLGDE